MTCQNAADEIRTGPTALDYVSLLSCSGIISRFGRQSRPGERVDSGLTAFRLSEFATLDKIRLRYKMRLGRFITSPRLACLPPLALPSPQFPHLILGTDPVLRGARPRKVCQKHIVILIFFAIIDKMVGNKNSMRNILKLILLRLKRLDIVARSAEVRQGGQDVFALHSA